MSRIKFKGKYLDASGVYDSALGKTQAEINAAGGGGGEALSSALKTALMQLAQHVAYTDDSAPQVYIALYNALYDLDHITAVFVQGSTQVYPTTALDNLKSMLTVTAYYDDGTSAVLPDSAYTLSGTLTVGTSTVMVSYRGKTTTFTVMVEEATTTMISGFDDSNSRISETAGPFALKYDSVYAYDYTKDVVAIKLNVATAGNLAIGVIPLTSFSGNHVIDNWAAIIVKDNLTISEIGTQTIWLNSPFKVPEDNVIVIGTGAGEFPIEPTSSCLWKYGNYGTQKGFSFVGGSSTRSLGIDIIVR